MTVTKSLEKILIDLTGEPRAEVALHVALKDVVVHRLEIVECDIKKMETKYHVTFPEFKRKWEEGQIEKNIHMMLKRTIGNGKDWYRGRIG